MYNHRSNFLANFLNDFPQEVDAVVKIFPNIVLGNLVEKVSSQLSCLIQIQLLQPCGYRHCVIHHFLMEGYGRATAPSV